jgi:hypothetical protein
VPLKPARGRGCPAPFAGDEPAPLRHQVIEMPPMKMVQRPRLSFRPVRCHHKLRRDSCLHKVNGYLEVSL